VLSLLLSLWISPDATGAVDGLNLYVYVGNNPLKYTDPTGYVVVGLGVVFAAFAEDVGADVQSFALLFCLVSHTKQTVVIGNKPSPFTQITTVALKITTKITLMPMAIY
jgi:hypothetical protein